MPRCARAALPRDRRRAPRPDRRPLCAGLVDRNHGRRLARRTPPPPPHFSFPLRVALLHHRGPVRPHSTNLGPTAPWHQTNSARRGTKQTRLAVAPNDRRSPRAAGAGDGEQGQEHPVLGPEAGTPPPPAPRTDRTRLVPPPVLIGHAAGEAGEARRLAAPAHGRRQRHGTPARPGARSHQRGRDEMCPVSTGGWTRRVRLVRGVPSEKLAFGVSLTETRVQCFVMTRVRDAACPISTG
jgi:hypothetical protein